MKSVIKVNPVGRCTERFLYFESWSSNPQIIELGQTGPTQNKLQHHLLNERSKRKHTFDPCRTAVSRYYLQNMRKPVALGRGLPKYMEVCANGRIHMAPSEVPSCTCLQLCDQYYWRWCLLDPSVCIHNMWSSTVSVQSFLRPGPFTFVHSHQS